MDAHVASGTSPDSPEISPVEQLKLTKRAGYIAGLRELADLLEQHPNIPLPYHGSSQEYAALAIHHLGRDEGEKAAFAATVAALPGRREKRVREGDYTNDGYFEVRAVLGGGLHLRVTAFRETVCERVVVGKREVEVPARAEQVIPATEARVDVVEDVEWRCAPVLG